MYIRYLLLALLFCGFIHDLISQAEIDTSVAAVDTSSSKNSFTTIFYGDPGKAALYSLIVPGAGQLYNKRWWKAPLIWAGEGYLLYNLINKQSTFSTLDNCWKSLVEPDNFICNTTELTESQLAAQGTTNESFIIRNSARSQRDQAWIFFVAGHLINVFEAFVDRHLINFDTSDRLTFTPTLQSISDPILNANSSEMASTTLFSIYISLSR